MISGGFDEGVSGGVCGHCYDEIVWVGLVGGVDI